ncbi:hypothetical protein B0H11DRAFT_1902397 [Mycena galericulata]|nr:hypothetical protein B0H11DRAFT_1902397 [Mycena galericulata]
MPDIEASAGARGTAAKEGLWAVELGRCYHHPRDLTGSAKRVRDLKSSDGCTNRRYGLVGTIIRITLEAQRIVAMGWIPDSGAPGVEKRFMGPIMGPKRGAGALRWPVTQDKECQCNTPIRIQGLMPSGAGRGFANLLLSLTNWLYLNVSLLWVCIQNPWVPYVTQPKNCLADLGLCPEPHQNRLQPTTAWTGRESLTVEIVLAIVEDRTIQLRVALVNVLLSFP